MNRAETPAPTFTLWFRPRAGVPWELVATVATCAAALALVGCGERRAGDWYIGEDGRTP